MRAHASPAGLALATSKGDWKLYRHLAIANKAITQLIRRQIPQRILAIEMPPRHGKSELASHWTPTWFVQEYPDRLAGVTSYNGQFARKWGREARTSFRAAWEYHGRQVDRRRDGASEWGSEGFRKGGMIAAGVNEALTGRGLGLLVVDDPIKNASQALSENYRQSLYDWWQSTAFTRLDRDGVAIVMQTRWHEDDLIGWLVKQAQAGTGLSLARLRLQAIAGENDPMGRKPGEALCPELGWDEERLAETKLAQGGGFWWKSLYQQIPGQMDRSEWPDEYFVDEIWAKTLPNKYQWNVVALDLSKGKDARNGDYVAMVRISWAHGKYWVESFVRRVAAEGVAATCADWIQQRRPDLIYIEGNGGQYLFEPLLRRVLDERRIIHPPIVTVDSVDMKEIRIATLGPQLAHLMYRFVDSGDNRLLVRMLKEWPIGDYDDGPDALEMATRMINRVAAINTKQAKSSREIEQLLNGRR